MCVALRICEWDVPEVIVRNPEVSDDVATGGLRIPGQLINARKPARDELRSSATSRKFPKIGVRAVVAGLLVRQILVQRVEEPFAVGRQSDRHARRLPVLRKPFDRGERTALQIEPGQAVRRGVFAEVAEQPLAVGLKVELALRAQ